MAATLAVGACYEAGEWGFGDDGKFGGRGDAGADQRRASKN